jgi:predicted transcriptional regulator of viral defense system
VWLTTGARQPGRLADRLLLRIDGAFAAARMFGIENPRVNVAEAARMLIDAPTPAYCSSAPPYQ